MHLPPLPLRCNLLPSCCRCSRRCSSRPATGQRIPEARSLAKEASQRTRASLDPILTHRTCCCTRLGNQLPHSLRNPLPASQARMPLQP